MTIAMIKAIAPLTMMMTIAITIIMSRSSNHNDNSMQVQYKRIRCDATGEMKIWNRRRETDDRATTPTQTYI